MTGQERHADLQLRTPLQSSPSSAGDRGQPATLRADKALQNHHHHSSNDLGQQLHEPFREALLFVFYGRPLIPFYNKEKKARVSS